MVCLMWHQSNSSFGYLPLTACHNLSYLAVVASDMVSKFPHSYSSHALGCMLPRLFCLQSFREVHFHTPSNGLISLTDIKVDSTSESLLYFSYFASQHDRTFSSKRITVCGPNQSPHLSSHCNVSIPSQMLPCPRALVCSSGWFPVNTHKAGDSY